VPFGVAPFSGASTGTTVLLQHQCTQRLDLVGQVGNGAMAEASPMPPRRSKKKSSAAAEVYPASFWAPGAFGHPPVDAFRQHRQLRGRQRHHPSLT
jgi:hypothetical protein